MRAAFVILAHERFDRVGAVARHLAEQNANFVVHVDRQAGPAALQIARRAIGDAATVISTRRTVWGQFGLVEATLDAVRALLSQDGGFSHVALLSGSCLPIRPLRDLDVLLADHPDTDFIESVPVAEAKWVQDGLSDERFTLWHPFPWRSQRRLFDLNVELQRRLRIRRRMPSGLTPHLGLQWWCLSRATLERILGLPDLPVYAKFFRRSWIPDESFFQTVIRAHGAGRIASRSLTLQRFDAFGRPYVFHDDHADLLATANAYFARKIDPDAEGLYSRFLDPDLPKTDTRQPIDTGPFDRARAEVTTEGQGTASAGRMQRLTSGVKIITNAPYLVIVGKDARRMLTLRASLVDGDVKPVGHTIFHGFLFGASDTEFVSGEMIYDGNIHGSAHLRNYRPVQFLRQVLRADRGRTTVFMFRPRDDKQVSTQLCRDPNARMIFLADTPREAALAHMRTPAQVYRLPKLRLRPRRAPQPVEINAWTRVLEVDPNAPGGEAAALGAILASDLADPTGWTVPDTQRREIR